MMISASPCPKCDSHYYLIPYCEKCGWKDETWFAEQLEIAEDLRVLFDKSYGRNEKWVIEIL